jgi:hypothetical protein
VPLSEKKTAVEALAELQTEVSEALCYSACKFDPLRRGIGVQN